MLVFTAPEYGKTKQKASSGSDQRPDNEKSFLKQYHLRPFISETPKYIEFVIQ